MMLRMIVMLVLVILVIRTMINIMMLIARFNIGENVMKKRRRKKEYDICRFLSLLKYTTFTWTL